MYYNLQIYLKHKEIPLQYRQVGKSIKNRIYLTKLYPILYIIVKCLLYNIQFEFKYNLMSF